MTGETPPAAKGVTEALRAAREEIVVAIAFLGRDAGTDRIDGTIRGLIDRLVKADQEAQAALAALSLPAPRGGGGGAKDGTQDDILVRLEKAHRHVYLHQAVDESVGWRWYFDLFNDCMKSIIHLQPFKDELLKIAEDVGEASDPFAAWESIEAMRVSTPAAPELGAVKDGWVLVPKTALDWLFGEGPDEEGHWFGDGNFPTKGAYWWRTPFRAMISASPQQGEGQ